MILKKILDRWKDRSVTLKSSMLTTVFHIFTRYIWNEITSNEVKG